MNSVTKKVITDADIIERKGLINYAPILCINNSKHIAIQTFNFWGVNIGRDNR